MKVMQVRITPGRLACHSRLPGRPVAVLSDRFLWIALFVVCFCTATFFIARMWAKWESSPVLISVETTDFPNSELYFPTVSVCPVNKVSSNKLRLLFQDE